MSSMAGKKVSLLLISVTGMSTVLAGCQTEGQEVAMAPPAAQVQAAATPAATQGDLPNGTLRANILGRTATLSVAGGQPVGYSSGGYTAQNVRRLSNGDIQVDYATVRNVSVSGNQVHGIWDFRGVQTPVVFQ